MEIAESRRVHEAEAIAFMVRMFRAVAYHLILEYKCSNGCWMGIEVGKRIERNGRQKC